MTRTRRFYLILPLAAAIAMVTPEQLLIGIAALLIAAFSLAFDPSSHLDERGRDERPTSRRQR